MLILEREVVVGMLLVCGVFYIEFLHRYTFAKKLLITLHKSNSDSPLKKSC